MLRPRLSIAVVVSVVAFGLICLAYAGSFTVGCERVTPRGSTADGAAVYLGLNNGRILINIAILNGYPAAGIPLGVNFAAWHHLYFKYRFDHWITGFEAGRESGAPAGVAVWTFGMPAWCGLLLCSVAPTLWARRRAKRERRGFAVQTATVPSVAADEKTPR